MKKFTPATIYKIVGDINDEITLCNKKPKVVSARSNYIIFDIYDSNQKFVKHNSTQNLPPKEWLSWLSEEMHKLKTGHIDYKCIPSRIPKRKKKS